VPREIARRAALKRKLDAACARLEAEAQAQAEAERPQYEATQAAYKSAMGFTRFHLRGLANLAMEWLLVALAYNCRAPIRQAARPALLAIRGSQTRCALLG
jgi:hypothetical protein